MLTRRTLRRALLLAGMSLGVCGLLILLLSFIGTVRYESPWRGVSLGRGSISISTQFSRRQFNDPAALAAHARMGTTPGLTFSTDRQRRWQWQPQFTQAQYEQPGRLTIPWWLLTSIGLISLYFYLPPGHAKGHCQRCNFDLANLPPDPDHPSKRRCPECGHLSTVSGTSRG